MYTLFALQGVFFASHRHFICTTGRVVCIKRTIYLHHRACCLHHTYNLFVRQSVRFASHIQFICTTERAVCSPRTVYLHHMKCGLHHTHNFVVVAVPSTVPTSEALLPRRSSRHPPPPATPRAHSASRPRPQKSTGSDVRSLVGCHPKETLHCC